MLYKQEPPDVARLMRASAAAARHAIDKGLVERVELAFGDCSPTPTLGADAIAGLREEALALGLDDLSVEFFDCNLGSAGGSNRLAESAEADLLLILNPDCYPAPVLLAELVEPVRDPSVGIVEGHQIPFEHPKEFDLVTGDTSWASGSCLLISSDLFRTVGGFDAEHFFLQCDDVDLSWRVRLAGFRVVHRPRAVVFHDKRLTENYQLHVPRAEEYHSCLGRLMLAHKYGREDIAEETLELITKRGSAGQREAVDEYRRRLREGRVPRPLPDGRSVAQFVAGEYAKHRF